MSDQNDRNEQMGQASDAPAEALWADTTAADTAETDDTEAPEQHHHHHHHHHRHHRRHRTKLGRMFSRIKRALRRHRRVLLAILIVSLAALVLLIATLIITYGAMTQRKNPEEETGIQQPVSREPQVLIQVKDTPYLLVPQPILSYTDRDSTMEPRQIQDIFSIQTNRADQGSSVSIGYAIVNVDRFVTVTSVTVTLSLHEDYSDAQVVRITRSDVRSVQFDHLETGRLYYFKIDADLDNGVVLTTEHYFYTVTSPRLMNLEGMTNVRDIGGWMYIDGEKAIKQGMLYRGSEFDGLNGEGTKATPAARDAMLTRLNISSVLDLRGPDKHINGLNELGKNVWVKCIGAPCYDEIMFRDRDEFDTQTEQERAAAAREQIKQIFSFLAEESWYPIYMHDTYGVHETGTVCALLEAFLGVSKQDILKDYHMSTFALSSVDRARFNALLTMLERRSSHGSLQEGAMLYLRDDCGVPSDDLLRIKNILLEDAHGVITYEEAQK